MGRLERLLWLLGLVGAFTGGLAMCRIYGEGGSAPSKSNQILISVGPEDWSAWNERGRARAHNRECLSCDRVPLRNPALQRIRIIKEP